jgi:hypothetical protein
VNSSFSSQQERTEGSKRLLFHAVWKTDRAGQWNRSEPTPHFPERT